MSEEKIFKKIQEQAKQYEEYNNFDREDLIDELLEEKRINENNLELINKQKEVLDKIKEYRKWLDKNTVIYNSGECVKLNGTYWEAEGIKIILDKILEEIE